MAEKALLSPEVVRKLLSYDPETGVLIWKSRDRGMFAIRRLWLAWNTKYAGRPALDCRDNTGYLHGRVLCQKVYAHRAAWVCHTGEWPEASIDHIDGDKRNNRIANLRSVSHAVNCTNVKRRSDNKSGVLGVFWHVRDSKWQAKIKVNGKDIDLGRFEKLEDAAEARRVATVQYGYHPNHGR
ncbi:MAG TPA: HNH endonuclease [Hyphomonas sp.]|nr:HNH endonuclease [Hyphomonas sp.]